MSWWDTESGGGTSSPEGQSFDPNTQKTTFAGEVGAPTLSATESISAPIVNGSSYNPTTQETTFPGAVVAPNVSRLTKWEKKERTNPFGSAAEFPRFDAAFQNFIKGTSDLVISFQGASHVDGIGSEGNGSSNLRPNRGSWVKFFGEKMRDLLGCNIGVFSTPTDYHWGEWLQPANGWQTSYFLGGVAQGRVIYNNSTTTPETFCAPDIEVEWDAVDLYYLKKSSAGNFTISATGGTPVPVNGYQASGNAIGKATCYAASPSRNNVFSIARVDGSVILVGATFYRAGFSKLVIMNCGVGGTTSGNWNDSTGTGLFGDEVARVAGAAMTFMSIGVNDQGSGVPVATYKANYQAIVSRVSPYSDFIAMPPFLCGATDTGTLKTDLDAYRDAIRDSVTGYRKFIDVRSKMQELSIPYANFSNQHPSRQGHRMITDLIWRELLG